MTLFGFGTATIDFRIVTADLGEEYRSKLLAREIRRYGGGATANSLVQATRLGIETQWLGRIGGGSIGAMILDDLASHRVRTDYVTVDDTLLSPFNLAAYAGEELRRIGGFLLPNSLASYSDGDLSRWAAAVGPDDWCLVEIGEIPIPVVRRFVEQAKARGARIVLDIDLDPVTQCVGGTPDLMAELFAAADYVLPNREAVAGMYRHDTTDELCMRIQADARSPVIMTCGADGACWCDSSGSVRWIEAFPVEVVDTVGAGDAFHGGCVAALMRGLPLETAIEVGNRCGAANCTAFGARSGMIDGSGIDWSEV